MADEDYAPQERERGDRPPRQSYQQFPQRSNASSNWRMKDDTPRADITPRQNRGGAQGRTFDSPGRSYNSNTGGQPRETSDTRLYVGNLLYSASRGDVEQFFTANGFNVSGISMSVDPATGRNPSYCFVDFETAPEASRAMNELNGTELLGRGVRINLGVARQGGSGSASGTPQGRPGYGAQGGNRSWGQDSPSNSSPRYNRDSNQGSTFHQTVTGPNDQQTKRLYIGNLPNIPSASVEELISSLFSPLNIETTSISKLISPHESKASLPGDHHYLFVDLARAEDAELAIENLDGPGKVEADWIGADGLKVNKARESERRRQGTGFGREGGDRERGGWGGAGRDRGDGAGSGGYQSRRTEGFRDWRKSERQEE